MCTHACLTNISPQFSGLHLFPQIAFCPLSFLFSFLDANPLAQKALGLRTEKSIVFPRWLVQITRAAMNAANTMVLMGFLTIINFKRFYWVSPRKHLKGPIFGTLELNIKKSRGTEKKHLAKSWDPLELWTVLKFLSLCRERPRHLCHWPCPFWAWR